MDVLVMVGQLLLGLSILVGLHEFGHYITAKWFGMRVNKFYLFFDFLFPLPTVLNFSLWKKKIGDTVYGLGWFPLGGYVDIAGMIDESKDASQLESEPQPWEFRSKPAWQRLIVMLGGIIVNVILGCLIFIGLTYKNGYDFFAPKDIEGIVAMEYGQKAGLKTGDKILTIKGVPMTDFSQIPESLLETDVNFTVERDGKQLDIKIPNDMMNQLSDKKSAGKFVKPLILNVVDSIPAESPALKAGLKKGDRILAVNNVATPYFHQLGEQLDKFKNKKVTLKIARNTDTLTLNPTIDADGKIGFMNKNSHIDYGFGESVKRGISEAFDVVFTQIKAFGKMFRRDLDVTKSLGSFITISKVYGSIWDWDHFWTMTGMLSMVLAFMNLLPIPALDGGHAVILLYEMITGRKPSERFLEIAQQVGMVLLLALMVFAIGNDIFRNFFK